MKEQLKSAVLPKLPIVGNLKISTKDGKSISMIEVVKAKASSPLDPFFLKCFQELSLYLTGKTRKINLPVDFTELTPFQIDVLKQMKNIPFGKVATYKEIAENLNIKAYQAIGSACGRNPFLLIYPCHRVLGTNNPGGFAHGLKMKKELLRLEGQEL